jgi:hypothetical protein
MTRLMTILGAVLLVAAVACSWDSHYPSPRRMGEEHLFSSHSGS